MGVLFVIGKCAESFRCRLNSGFSSLLCSVEEKLNGTKVDRITYGKCIDFS